MTQGEFVQALESALQQTGRPFDRSAVLAFVADCWPWIEEDPDVHHWCGEFLQSQQSAQEE